MFALYGCDAGDSRVWECAGEYGVGEGGVDSVCNDWGDVVELVADLLHAPHVAGLTIVVSPLTPIILIEAPVNHQSPRVAHPDIILVLKATFSTLIEIESGIEIA